MTLVADGSATGEGLVDIVNGAGTLDISNQVAQTVNLSLSDSQTTGFAVTSTQDVVFAHGAATQLAITQQPTTTVAGVSISPALTVEVQDQYGNTVTTGGDSTASVAVALSTGTGTLSGTTPVAAVAGVATFGDLSIELIGTDKELTFSSGSLTSAVSNSFTITHAAASQYIISDPTDGTVDAAITVTVQLQDQFGNTVHRI